MNLLLTPIGRGLAGGAVLLATFLGWLFVHDTRVEQRGADKAVTTIKKANTDATKLGGDAATGALDGRVRGRRDPTTRND